MHELTATFGTPQIGALAALATVLLTGIAIFVTLRGIRDQLRLQTFSEYTRRYGEIVRDLPSESRSPVGEFDLSSLLPERRDVVLNTARAYLNMTSEEFFLNSKGHIDPDTWEIWQAGMRETLGLPWLRQAWQELRPEYTYVAEFAHFVDSSLSEDKTLS